MNILFTFLPIFLGGGEVGYLGFFANFKELFQNSAHQVFAEYIRRWAIFLSCMAYRFPSIILSLVGIFIST